jgi:hypothetical protein
MELRGWLRDPLGVQVDLMRPNQRMYNLVLVALIRKYLVGLAISIFFKLLDGSSSWLCLVAKVKDPLNVWEQLK